MLLVHGNPTWSYLWRHQLRDLPAAGHRCVAFDHMGFGRSDKPPHLSAYTLRRHIDNALAVVDSLDLRDVVLVVHDWGGPIGLGAMLERADRLRGLVIMNTWAWELPSFLPPFVREFRNEGLGEILALGGNLFVESIPGGMANRDTDPLMMAAYRAPVPGLLVAGRDAGIPAGHPAHRARPQRRPDRLDPRAATGPGRARSARLGHARPRVPADLPGPVARAVPGRDAAWSWTTPGTTSSRIAPTRSPRLSRTSFGPCDPAAPAAPRAPCRHLRAGLPGRWSAASASACSARGSSERASASPIERVACPAICTLAATASTMRPATSRASFDPRLDEHERELVATDPESLVPRPAAAKDAADLGEHRVSARMPVAGRSPP